MSEYLYPFSNCGCGGSAPDDEEVERIIREVETEREDEPILIPIVPGTPVPNWPTRKAVEVE